MKASTRVLGMVAAVLAAVSAPVWAERDSRDSKDSLSELTGQWWQWALAPPVPSNPIADTLGTNCMVGQRGTVWFLGGTTTGGVIRRRCSVPQGVTLFFPVINSIYFDTPNICGQGPSLSVRELRAGAAPFIDAVTVAVATFDNKPIKLTRRIRSEPFVTVLPANNIFVQPCKDAGFAEGVPAGVYSASVDDGYYGKVDGLDPGVHTLVFRAKSGTFDLDVEYVLNVVPVSREVK